MASSGVVFALLWSKASQAILSSDEENHTASKDDLERKLQSMLASMTLPAA